VRLGLEYERGTGPARLFLKAHAASHRVAHLRNGNLWNEARLFASDVPLPVDHPIVYKSVVDLLGLDFLLVMEDLTLRDADPRDATRPLSPDQVARGLASLAALHSLYWNLSAQSHPALDWLQTWQATEGWQIGLRRNVSIGLERAGEALPAAVRTMSGQEIVERWARYVDTLANAPVTLTHGDAHIGNTYVLPGGDVGFLDWQVVRRGRWSQDVGYFLIGSLTEDDRRRHERELIEGYRQALDVPGPERPSREAAWREYRSSPAYGLAIWLSTLGSDGWQRPEVSLTLSERFAAAFVELDSDEALG
jgi:aminoglycoside phosphotransferase (APT) family kinase protein